MHGGVMHLYKKTLIAMLVGSCLGSVALAQDDNFTISITGPSDSQVAKKVVTRDTNTTQVKAKVNTTTQQKTTAKENTTTPAKKVEAKVDPKDTPKANAKDDGKSDVLNSMASKATPHLLANESNTPTQEYDIQKQDTIWSIANKFLPANSPVNEFQAVASIYRHNPDAFARGNVNNLRMTKIKIPSAEMMALESPKTGSELLKKGSIQLPPLSAANTKTATGGALPDNVLNMFDSQLAKNQQGKKTTEADIAKALNIPSTPNTKATTSAAPAQDEPNYVAHETAVKNNMIDADGVNQFARSAEKQSTDAADTTQLVKSVDISKLLNKSNDMNKIVNSNNVAPDADSLALQELIKKSQVDTKRQYNVLSKKIDEGILRSEVVAKSAASTVAKDEVIKALTDYEQIINQLQQANIELRATLARMNKQIDNVRALGLQNQDGLADVHQLLSNYSSGTSLKSDKAPEGPMMWILLGVGLLSLILASTFMVIRMKTKSSNKQTQTAMANMSDDDDGASSIEDEVLLSSTVHKTDDDVAVADIDEKKK